MADTMARCPSKSAITSLPREMKGPVETLENKFPLINTDGRAEERDKPVQGTPLLMVFITTVDLLELILAVLVKAPNHPHKLINIIILPRLPRGKRS